LNGRYPTRFTALAALPLQDPVAAAAELERAVTQLSLPGGMIFTNINGQTMDEVRFLPVLEKAVELDVPLFMHPTIPTHIGSLGAYRLVALIGFTQETTIAASRMLFSGLFERLPQLKIVLSHLGGHIPYIAERLALGHRIYPECRTELSQSPLETLKRFYMDTIPYAPQATQYAIEFSGADKLLLGSDYPHQIGDLPGAVTTIQKMAISEADKAKILGENAVRLLRLNQ
ncbi:2-amino-3-carboxymuconate-6-semialdehyde decarboxylase, partial [hydrothermal vent metagenome]